MGQDAGRGRTDPLDYLSEAWRVLRLSVRCPARVATWDAVVLTAASPAQAELFQRHLEQAQGNGTIARQTAVLAVPDPEGRRIGSGAATLCALRALAHHIQESEESAPTGRTALPRIYDPGLRVLLLHTGGDSKRVPWANPIGKAFMPLPFLAAEDPDGPVLTLFDHILAVSAWALQSFSNKGGLLIMAGDVLPCFHAAALSLPDDGAVVVTVRASLARAAKHGVILASQGNGDSGRGPPLVDDLLQKPSGTEMSERGAVRPDGTTTRGSWPSEGPPCATCLRSPFRTPTRWPRFSRAGTKWVSLYEEIAGAWVPARHKWLASRRLGKKLIDALGSNRLYHHCAEELEFLHFGTSREVLDHLAEDHGGRVARNQFSAIPGGGPCEVAASAVLVGCDVCAGASVGANSFAFSCTLAAGTWVGARCVAAGLYAAPDGTAPPFVLPDRHCLWRVPVAAAGVAARVTLCCGLDDDPKVRAAAGGTFCGQPWAAVMGARGISAGDLWRPDGERDLWHARLFPVAPHGDGLRFSMWLMGVSGDEADRASVQTLRQWRACRRLSLSDLHSHVDFQQLNREVGEHTAALAAGFLQASIACGSLGRNFAPLCGAIVRGNLAGVAVLRDLGSRLPDPDTATVPPSRVYQAQLDIAQACGDDRAASALDDKVWDAVARETSAAMRRSDAVGKADIIARGLTEVMGSNPGRSKVELPVRLDIVGGWSDTPPWSLERTGRVLNMAVQLDGRSPLGAEVVLLGAGAGVTMRDDAGNIATLADARTVVPPFDAGDPFRLVKAALVVTGFAGGSAPPAGLEISTWSDVPRGSGLGVSSILAAAVVQALLEVRRGDASPDNVVRLVFVLEQIMGTGGGWQDQVGGVYPGIKCTTSLPGRPMRLQVKSVPVSNAVRLELESRMVVVFTGQVRLAHTVLQKVVQRYLQRDERLVAAIETLAVLAARAAAALAAGDLDAFGRAMAAAWRLHQELDPGCSSASVDALFRRVEPLSCGHKLVGAGGGGFGVIVAKSVGAAQEVRSVLRSFGPPVQLYDWCLLEARNPT